ncbi:myofilin isoform X2 [Haematobia irritans]|uniref:myofilin isoform X2 n=1 Tax=Haematobia irritans TaxID=7368 RepID=UPI003F50CEF5
MFKNHLEMIGRNESPSKKAKFWQSYIRSLKGSEDIRAHETPRAGRPYSSYLDAPSTFRSIYEEPATANERVQSHGYRYLPVSRDTYGYSPRAIYDHHYSRTTNYDAERAWNDHLKRMQEIERRYPSRYGLYLKDKPYTPNALVPLEYEPEDKLLQELNKARRSPSPSRVRRAGSEPYVPPPSYWSGAAPAPAVRAPSVFDRAPSVFDRAPSVFDRAASLAPFTRPLFRASSLEPLDELFASKSDEKPEKSEKPERLERAGSPSPTPVKAGRWGPRPNEVSFDADGLPVFPRNRFRDMLEPNPNAPISAFTRDPFWWDMEDLAPIRARSPFRAMSMPRASSPPITRDSFLSPIKNRYLWTKHPARPLTPAEEEELFENF